MSAKSCRSLAMFALAMGCFLMAFGIHDTWLMVSIHTGAVVLGLLSISVAVGRRG